MTLFWILVTIFGAGGVGGLVNALMTDNGFVFPKWEAADRTRILRPGWIGNVLISGIGASVSWGLYGPFAATIILGGDPQVASPTPSLGLSGLVGAVLVGIAGARWLTNEVDKNLLRAAGARAARTPSDNTLAAAFISATPAQLLTLTNKSSTSLR
jgi:hypothetical protein